MAGNSPSRIMWWIFDTEQRQRSATSAGFIIRSGSPFITSPMLAPFRRDTSGSMSHNQHGELNCLFIGQAKFKRSRGYIDEPVYFFLNVDCSGRKTLVYLALAVSHGEPPMAARAAASSGWVLRLLSKNIRS